jgi:hypothetical protein
MDDTEIDFTLSGRQKNKHGTTKDKEQKAGKKARSGVIT